MNDYDSLRDYLKKQKLPEFVLSFEQIEEIIDAPLLRGASRVVVGDLAQPAGEDAAAARGSFGRRLCVATRLADGKSVRFKQMRTAR